MTTLPTLQELNDEFISGFEAEFGVTISPYGKSFLRGLAGEEAAMMKLFYLAIGNLQKNIFVDTAEPASVGGTLERFGYVKLGRYPYPATQGQYTCDVIGTAGAVIPAQTQFKSDDSSLNPGFLYILDNAYTLTGSSDTITLRALTAGTDSLLATTNTLTATQPLVNVNAQVEVSAISVAPVDAETDEQYREKALQAYRLSPQGGAVADYRIWADEVAGVRQVYDYTSALPNEVDVFVEAFPDDSTDGKGTPSGTILTNVTNAINADPDTGLGRKPLGVFQVNVSAITPLDVDITINSGGTITPDQETLINVALSEYIFNIRPFIAGADDVASRNDTISTYGIGNVIINTIGSALISAITLDVDGATVTDYTFDSGGEIPYNNSITYL